MPDPLANLRMWFTLIGSIGILIGVALAFFRISGLRARRRTAGEVTGVSRGMSRRTAGGSTARSQTVTVRFTDEDGNAIEASDTNAMGDYHEGQAVTVYHDRAEPTDALIAGFMRFWFLPLLFVGLGSMFATLAVTL